MRPTISDVLRVTAVAAGEPEIVGGADLLDTPVRWLHTTDGTDFSGLLRGGELILTGGERWLGTIGEATAYFDNLLEHGAAGVLVSPLTGSLEEKRVLREAAQLARIPVVLLRDRVAFVELTEAVHRRLIAEADGAAAREPGGTNAMRLIEQLSVEHADPTEVLRRTAELVFAPVVFEDLQRNVVAFAGAGVPGARLLADWQRRSRIHATGAQGAGSHSDAGHAWPAGAPEPSRAERWLRVPYRERGEAAGALVVPVDSVSESALAVLERAAQVLANCYENAGESGAMRHRALTGVIDELASPGWPSEPQARTRAEASGFAPASAYLPIAVLGAGADAVHDAAAAAGISLIAHAQAGIIVGVIGAADEDDRRVKLHAFASQLRGDSRSKPVEAGDPVLAVGPASQSLLDAIDRGCDEATAILAAAGPEARGVSFVTAADVRLRRMLRSFSGDRRMRDFVDETLEELRAEGGDLMRVLRAYLETNGNVAEVARFMYLSRPSVYARLRRIEAILGADLDNVDTRLGVHFALIAEESWEA